MQFAAFLMKIMSNAELGIECNDTYDELPIQQAEFFHILMECELEVDVDCSAWSRKSEDSNIFRFLMQIPRVLSQNNF